MIKKLLLLATAPFIGITMAAAQCTPDNSYTTAGIYPDTIPHAIVGQNYSEVLQFRVPTDSTFDYNGQPAYCTVTSVVIDSVNWSGLDSKGFSFACNPGNATFPGGSNGCLLISGTAPTADMAGNIYPLTVYLTYHLKFGGTIPFDTGQAITDFFIQVDDSGSASIHGVNVAGFEVFQNTPNPFSTTTTIDFTSPSATTYNFLVYNMLGEVVYSKNVDARKGINKVNFSAASLKEGIYLYSLGNDKAKVVKRMTVSK